MAFLPWAKRVPFGSHLLAVVDVYKHDKTWEKEHVYSTEMLYFPTMQKNENNVQPFRSSLTQ